MVLMSSELSLAVFGGRMEEVRKLVADAAEAHGIENVLSPNGDNVFHLAAGQGHHDLIDELSATFGNRSLLTSPNSDLDTPVHCAARVGHERVVSLLVRKAWGYGDNDILLSKNKAGDTALHLAAERGHGAVVKAIVSLTPEVGSVLNYAGVSSLYLAVESKSVLAVREITSSCPDASAAGPSSQNALHAAILRGSEMVGILLQWKTSLAGEADESGSTPLHCASSYGDRTIVGSILCKVEPWVVDMQDKLGMSALHVAAGMGYSCVTEALMDVSPDAAKLHDKRGGYFVHAAARGGHSKVVLLAIKKPMLHYLLNIQDSDGNTPLHLAVAAHAPGVAEALLRYGNVSAKVRNNASLTPLDLAAQSTSLFSMLDMVMTLAAFGVDCSPPRLDHAVKWRGDDIIATGIDNISSGLMTVSILIATVAFTVAYGVPGSYEQADDTVKNVSKGMAVLQHKRIFQCFIYLVRLALGTSVITVILLVFGKAWRTRASWKSYAAAMPFLWVSLTSMVLAFHAALSSVTRASTVQRIIDTIIFVVFFGLFRLVMWLVSSRMSICIMSKFLWQYSSKAIVRRSIRKRYDKVVDAVVLNTIFFFVTVIFGYSGIITIYFLGKKN